MAITIITDTVLVPNRFEVVSDKCEQLAICDTWQELQSLKSEFDKFDFIDHCCNTSGKMHNLPTVEEGVIEDF